VDRHAGVLDVQVDSLCISGGAGSCAQTIPELQA
jgi:hypothetical protein